MISLAIGIINLPNCVNGKSFSLSTYPVSDICRSFSISRFFQYRFVYARSRLGLAPLS